MTIFNNVGAMQDLPTYTVLINLGSAPNCYVQPMNVVFMLWINLWVDCTMDGLLYLEQFHSRLVQNNVMH